LREERAMSIFDGRYRLTRFRDRDWGQLFDLDEDPDALKNRWSDPAFADIRCEMTERLLNRLMQNLTPPDTREDLW
jgi:hypothetical protein